MNNLFNTPFESSLRILLLLSAEPQKAKSIDMISALDFIAIYGGCLGVCDINLNGENPFGFSELATRRKLIFCALKQLVMKGFVLFELQQNGFYYKLSSSGESLAANLNSDYAIQYLAAARIVLNFVGDKTEQELFVFINKQSTLALKVDF